MLSNLDLNDVLHSAILGSFAFIGLFGFVTLI